MKKKSKITAIILAVMMVFTMMPMTAGTVFADGETVYTVTVNPGEGTGTAFTVQSTTILSQSDIVAGNYDGTKGCFFRYDGEDAIWYRLPEGSFTAPEGREFDYWECSTGGSLDAGSVIPIANYGNITITAHWTGEGPSSITLSTPATINIKNGDAQTSFDIQIEELVFRQQADSAIIVLEDSVLSCTDNDSTISFTVTNNGIGAERSTTFSNSWIYNSTELPYTYQGFINIASDVWAAAQPGTYTGTLHIVVSDLNEDILSKEIALTLVVPGTTPPEPTKIAIPTGKTLTYNGKAQTGVAAGTGYTLFGTTSATNAGSYQATATLDEGYVWSDGSTAAKAISWKINAKAITPAVTLSASAYTYNGKVQKPTATVKDGSTKVAASQYDVTYASGRKNVGTYKVTVKMKGNYSGSKTVSFKINPKGTSLSKVTKAKKAATVKWKKQAAKMSTSRITGYQIQLATDSKFTKNKKTVNVKGYSKTSKKVTGLKGGKKYYVRIRTYKKVGSTTYYSPWSKTKTVTTGK